MFLLSEFVVDFSGKKDVLPAIDTTLIEMADLKHRYSYLRLDPLCKRPKNTRSTNTKCMD